MSAKNFAMGRVLPVFFTGIFLSLLIHIPPASATASGPDFLKARGNGPVSIHEAPGTSTPTLATLGADTRHIKNLGCITVIQTKKPTAEGTWCHVEFGGKKGWAQAGQLAEDSPPEAYTVVCENMQAPASATFVNHADNAHNMVHLSWQDISLALPQTISASGARYARTYPAGEYVFWVKGDTAFLDIPGEASRTCRLEKTR